jgi:hypothetical protein
MTLRVWLHEGHDGEPGVEAWAPDLLGFATWAIDEPTLLRELPDKLQWHHDWLRRHGHAAPASQRNVTVAGKVTGNEILLPPDQDPATPQEIDLAIALLGASRTDLLQELAGASDELLDWDPPYRRFAPWADWRSIRANLAHIANGETQYYLRTIGHTPGRPAAPTEEPWQALLARTRAEATSFLDRLKSSPDLARCATVNFGYGDEDWSVRKVLRRMVRHELMHLKSIRRIRAAYRPA